MALLGAIIFVPKCCINCWFNRSLSYALSPIIRSGKSAGSRFAKFSSASFTSAGAALSFRRARGSPWLTAMHMILMPLPRLVFPTERPLFWPEQTSRQQSILSDPICRPPQGAVPATKVFFLSLQNAPSSGSGCAPSGTVHTVVANLATAHPCAESITLRSTVCDDHSMDGLVHRAVPDLPAGWFRKLSTAVLPGHPSLPIH